MADPTDEWPAIRRFHLQGSCRARDVERELHLEPHASNGKIAVFSPPTYATAHAILNARAFKVIGVDAYQDLAQSDGRRPPSWHALLTVGKVGWNCQTQGDSWTFLAHAAFKQKNGSLWDIAHRVSHQLRVCECASGACDRCRTCRLLRKRTSLVTWL